MNVHYYYFFIIISKSSNEYKHTVQNAYHQYASNSMHNYVHTTVVLSILQLVVCIRMHNTRRTSIILILQYECGDSIQLVAGMHTLQSIMHPTTRTTIVQYRCNQCGYYSRMHMHYIILQWEYILYELVVYTSVYYLRVNILQRVRAYIILLLYVLQYAYQLVILTQYYSYSCEYILLVIVIYERIMHNIHKVCIIVILCIRNALASTMICIVCIHAKLNS